MGDKILLQVIHIFITWILGDKLNLFYLILVHLIDFLDFFN